jgi:hypothetical protein
VLALLFWFSLLTVNVFHLLFIFVVLLFVTKNEPEHRHSYRHRNWKYLQLLFNLFLLLRFVYALLHAYGLPFPSAAEALFDIVGISYVYSPAPQLFNLVPLLINAAIGLQYLTYVSTIYATHYRQPLLGHYQELLRWAGQILTIAYYKLLPWLSYLVILAVLLLQDFSVSSWVLLGWILCTLGVQLLSKHDLPSYRRMSVLWLGYMQLTALQIILRFAFEFTKFDVFAFIR